MKQKTVSIILYNSKINSSTFIVLGIKFSEDMYNVTEGDFILWLPVVRLRHYSQNISLAYFIEKFTENSRFCF